MTGRLSASAIAASVRSGQIRAVDVAEYALARIDLLNPTLNAFTDITQVRAIERAEAVDAAIAAGRDPGPLAGVPFAAKNLFDIRGVVTRAGSKINRGNLPAQADATLVERLEAAGAVLMGALNMGEYAYDFTGENAHDGPSRNPHDPTRMSGGSSGGSGTAAASGMVPLTLASDTNGSIRVPSSFCGLFGLKPTYGRLSRAGTFPFVASLDHLGPIARSAADLALAYDAMQGPDPADPVCQPPETAPVLPELAKGLADLRLAQLGGHFALGLHPEAEAAVEAVAAALGIEQTIEIEGAGSARAAAYLITMAEGAALHLDRLRTRHADFDPDVRDRLIAGAMIPGAWVQRAQKLRRAFRAEMARVFERFDVLIAPATPCPAPLIGQKTLTLNGKPVPLRPNLGLYTQPVSFVGLPVVAVPVWPAGSALPVGVQVIAPPWREDLVLRVAAALEEAGVARAPVAAAGPGQ
ncbi:MAG TPA: AtzE family amidohydrolase [Paracoccaceae bacterium]|nr:AtzE family amidohydrolase [Paracoccaceae bacterium]